MDVPHVKREDYQLTDIDDEYLVLMNDNGDLREDLKIPEGDLGTQLRSEYDGGKELLVSLPSASSSSSSSSLKTYVFVAKLHFLSLTPLVHCRCCNFLSNKLGRDHYTVMTELIAC